MKTPSRSGTVPNVNKALHLLELSIAAQSAAYEILRAPVIEENPVLDATLAFAHLPSTVGDLARQCVEEFVNAAGRPPGMGDRPAGGSRVLTMEPGATAYVVDWVERESTEDDEVRPHTGRFSRDQVVREFESRKHEFRLFLHEGRKVIYVFASNVEPLEVVWTDLDPDESRLLVMYLEALRAGATKLDYRTVATHALGEPGWTPRVGSERFRRLKYSLNVKLGHLLSGHLRGHAQRYRFDLRGKVSFCWIRPAAGLSRLWRQEPTC